MPIRHTSSTSRTPSKTPVHSKRRHKVLAVIKHPISRVAQVLLVLAIIIGTIPYAFHSAIANGIPSVALSFSSSQSSQPLIGENYSFTATFQNTSPSDVGYGPYVDLIFPVNGADGNHASSTADGTDFISATYLGTALQSTTLTFPASSTGIGCVSHPYAVDTAGHPLQYCGATGDKLVVLQLPFGSFTPGQPALPIIVSASLSNLADANTPLTIQARAGFQYGNDALNNPSTDPTIVGSLDSLALTPTILRIKTVYNGPEGEIATGPNDPKSYTVSVDIPNGMTVTNLELSDDLPINMQYVSVTSPSPGGSVVTSSPSTLTPSSPPNNRATVYWPTITGGAGSSDASYVLNFYIPKTDASSTDVINPSTGTPVNSITDIRAQANWTPTDVRDPITLVTSNVSPSDNTISDTPIAAQKGSSIAVDTGPAGLTPGDTVEYTINMQESDFFALQNVHATDTISDGQILDNTFTPTFSYTRNGVTSSGNMQLTNVSSTHDTAVTGNTYLDLNLSQELTDRGVTDGAKMLGGCVPTGGGTSTCAFFNGGLTTGVIKYRTVVQNAYTNVFPSGFPNIDQGDPISNSIRVKGDVLSTSTLLPTGSSVSNGSGTNQNIITGELTQETIYAVNGNTSFSTPVHISPGDQVTYRLQISQPTSNLDSFRVTDYLPLPIFSATTVTAFNATVSAAVPPLGAAKFGPNDTFFASNAVTPTISSSALANSLTFNYGSNIIPGGQLATVADILFTVRASDLPFADGLFLTSQAQSVQGDTEAQNAVSSEIVQLILNEPNLTLTKGVVSTDRASAVFSPTTLGPVTFQSPSGTCPSFSGTITSTNLATAPIGSSVSGIDAGDQVKYAMVVENKGGSPSGAFDVELKDVLPTGMSASSTGIHLCAMRGDGVAIPFTDLGGGLFGSGIKLNNVSSTQGSINTYSTTTGQNIAVITYDLTSNGNTLPGSSTTNTATLFNYAGDENGPDFTAIDQTASVNVTMKIPTISKTILGTSATSTSGNDVVVGERVQYEATVVVPEATSTGVTLVDALPTGMIVQSLDSLTASSSVSTTAGGGFAGALAAATVSTNGRTTTINLGTVSNTDRDNSATETIQLVITGIVTNVASNSAGTGRTNSATWNWTGSSVSANAPAVTVRQPQLTLSKTASPAILTGGETTTFTLTVAHASTSTQPAYEVNLQDLLPVNFAYVPSTLVNVSGDVATLDDSSTTDLLASWNQIATGTTSVIQFQATAANNSIPGSILTNIANVQWSTLQGDVTASSSPYAAGGCERTGNGQQACGTTANDLSSTTTRPVPIGSATIAKSLIATSDPSTLGTNVAIGEILTYQVTVGIPDGTFSTGTTLTDTLPVNGLSILDLTSITASGTLSTSHSGGFAGVLADATTTSSGTALSFPFDDITNSDNTTSTHETVILTYRAVVLNTASNVKGTTRNNSATWHWNGTTVSASAGNVTIAEPVLKNTLAASTSTGDAGDVVTYTETISHAATSTAEAYEVSLDDLIPADMVYVPSSLINISGEPATLSDSSATDLTATWSSLDTASSSVIQFQATVAVSATPGEDIITSSTLVFSSLPGDVSAAQSVFNANSCERSGVTTGCGGAANTYRVNASKTFTVPIQTAIKALISTSELSTSGTSTAIGEEAAFEFTVTLPEGTSPSLNLHDFLPSGMAYAPGSVVVSSTSFGGTVPAPIVTSSGGSGDDIDIDFGSIVTNGDNVPTNNSFTIDLQALVLNVSGNNSGAILDDNAKVTVGSSSSTSNHVALKIVEPQLQTTKNASDSAPAFGEAVTYTLNISHTTSSNADAFNPVITDLIPSGMSYNLGSSILPSGWSVNEGANPTIVFSAADLPFASSSAIITYQATAGDTSGTDLGAVLTNYATTTWTSLPSNVDPNERTGSGGINDYLFSVSKSLTVTGPDIHVSKTDGGASVSPSSTVAYALTYGNSGNGSDTGVVLHETVPVGSIFNQGASTPGWTCADASPAATACDLTIGVLGAGASSTVNFAVTAVNPAVNGLNQLSNTVTITDSGVYSDPTPGDESSNDTTPLNAAPDFSITKTDNATSTMPGFVQVYTLNYANLGDQDAAGVTLTETVPANATFNAASSSLGWSGCVDGSASGTVCTYTVGALGGGGANGTAQFAVHVDYPLLSFTTSLSNTATIQDDGTNGVDPNLSNNSASDTDPIIQEGPEYAVTVSDGVDQLSPGQSVTLTYSITNNGNVNGTGVAVTSTLPSYLDVLGVSDGGVATTTASGTQIITWPLFSLVGGNTTVLRTANVQLDGNIPSGTTSTLATASVQDDSLNGPDPFMPNNVSSDRDEILFPPTPGGHGGGGLSEGGGGGGGGGEPPVTYQTITYEKGVPVESSSTTPTVQAEPEPVSKPVTPCNVDCANTTYDVTIVNPDGTERSAASGYAQVEKVSATRSIFHFEDRGKDFDYNDVLVQVDRTDCLSPVFTLLTVNANWHHQVYGEIYIKGVLKDKVLLWKDSHVSLGQSKVIHAASDTALCAVPVCKLTSCAGIGYQMYIVNPDGTPRAAGTKYEKTTRVSSTDMKYAFEDKGADFDYNDVILDVNDVDCSNIQVTAQSTSARWSHQIRMRLTKDGVVRDDLQLWSDSHDAPGQHKAVNALTDQNMCTMGSSLGQSSVTVYQDINYGGRSESFPSGQSVPNLATSKFADIISSVKVYGDASVRLFHDKVYKGISELITSDIADLRKSIMGQDSSQSLQVQASFSRQPTYPLSGSSTPSTLNIATAASTACQLAHALTTTLGPGSNGGDVPMLQQFLNCLAFFPQNVVANGNYGPATVSAVKAFQLESGLNTTGSVGPQTRQFMNAFAAPQKSR